MIHFPKKQIYLPKRILSEQEMKYFLSLPDIRSSKGTRDRAILELLYSTGIRRAELTGLDIFDLNIYDQTIKVSGKGKHERIVPVGRVAMQWIRRYLDKVRVNINTLDPALFIDLNCFHRMKVTTINYIIGEYNSVSRLKKRVTPHVFRHTCATHLLQNGAGIRYIQELLGHASPATTQIYTRVVIKDLKEVYMRTHPRASKK